MAAPVSKMTLWGDMTPAMRKRKAVYFVRRRGWSYRQTAEYLHASIGAIAGALSRAEDRRGPSRQQLAGASKSMWTEERLTETWAQRKRRLARQEGANV